MAEKYRRFSTYNYAGDNPIINIDPDGMGFFSDLWNSAKKAVSNTVDALTNIPAEAKALSQMSAKNLAKTYVKTAFNALPAVHLAKTYINATTAVVNGDSKALANVIAPEMVNTAVVAATAGVGEGAAAIKNAFKATAGVADVGMLFHSTSSTAATSSILNEGINPAYFNSASRFGGGFYMSNDIATSAAELSYHGSSVANTIQFTSEGGNFLNATSPAMSVGVNFAPKVMAGAAQVAGYDGIMYNSLRGPGVNVVQFSNFETLTGGTVVP